MKMKMIPSGHLLLQDVWKDLTERYANLYYPTRPKFPHGTKIPADLLGMYNFNASYMLQQALLDGNIVAFYTDIEDVRKIPRGFWRDNAGNNAIWSGFTPEKISGESEWIYIERRQYEDFLSKLDVATAEGTGLLEPVQSKFEPNARRRYLSASDIPQAVAMLKNESLTENMTRDEQRRWLRQTFADRDISEANFRSIFNHIPIKRGRPTKSDEKS